MDSDFQELEDQLRDIRPAALDDRLLDRLTSAIAGTQEATDAELRPIEAVASKLAPAPLSDELTERLSGVLDQVPFPANEKVVLFPRGSVAAATTPKKKRSSWLAAAAAVALAGGLSAWMMSPEKQGGQMAGVMAEPVSVDSGAFVPASFNTGVSDTDDLGVIWSEDRQPFRVVRVIYMDEVTFLNEKGEAIHRKEPRVEYLMVREKID